MLCTCGGDNKTRMNVKMFSGTSPPPPKKQCYAQGVPGACVPARLIDDAKVPFRSALCAKRDKHPPNQTNHMLVIKVNSRLITVALVS